MTPTCGREGPGGCTVALVQWLVDLPGPLLHSVEVSRKVLALWVHVHLHGAGGDQSYYVYFYVPHYDIMEHMQYLIFRRNILITKNGF